MAKRKETLEIEQALALFCKEKRIYGCEEVTIGFYNNGHGNEIVDFITMDSKGIFRCYEIKVTLADLKSKAKKSFYGNYNYLVVTKELYEKVKDWSEHIPDWVGILVYHESSTMVFQGVHFHSTNLETKRRPRDKNPDSDTRHMLAMSMTRSMYHKIEKYKDANNLEKHKELMKEARDNKIMYENESKERQRLQGLINQFVWARRRLTGNKVYFEEIVEFMCKKALKQKSNIYKAPKHSAKNKGE